MGLPRLAANLPRNEGTGASWAFVEAEAADSETGSHQLDRARRAGTSNAGNRSGFWRLGRALCDLSRGGGREELHLVPSGTALAARPLVFE